MAPDDPTDFDDTPEHDLPRMTPITDSDVPVVYAWAAERLGANEEVWVAVADDGELMAKSISANRVCGQQDVHRLSPDVSARYDEKFGGPDEYRFVVVPPHLRPPAEVLAAHERDFADRLGHNARREVTVRFTPDGPPRLTLADGKDLSRITKQARITLSPRRQSVEVSLDLKGLLSDILGTTDDVRLDAETHDLLVALGWTPPAVHREHPLLTQALVERGRQHLKFSTEDEDAHTHRQLAHMAASLITGGATPYEERLVKAVALLMAEWERLDRATKRLIKEGPQA